ncbi:MAG: DUF4405 domain-containing protein [Prevotellaceae bacterium]|nr:DUF4405 domain-containing protein [Prevotellaceae bacterium]
MKRIFIIDWTLIPLFLFTAYTGIELHVAGHGSNHELWHNWAVFHVLASLLFLVIIVFHFATHWRWYKGLINKGIGNKSKVTVVLSVLFLFETISGIVLLFVDGVSSQIGLLHYGIGLIMSVIAIGHTLKRFPILRKSVKSRRH